MKSEFILAFNEICEQRGLPKDEVFEALKTALVSAYRRDTNIRAQQKVTVAGRVGRAAQNRQKGFTRVSVEGIH